MTVFFIHRAENVAEIPAFFIGVEVMGFDKLLNAFTPSKIVGVVKIDLLNRNLIGRNRIRIIRDTLGNPVMAGDDFHVPNAIFVGKEHRVTSWRTILFDELAKVFNAMTSRFNERQYHINNQVFIQTFFDKRIKTQCPFIAISAFRCRHCNVTFINAAFFVVAKFIVFNVWNRVVAITIFRQIRLEAIQR